MGEETEPHGYQFGEFRIYPAQRLLFRGDVQLHVGQAVFSLVVFMIRNPGRRLRKKEIIAGAWEKVAISDSTMANYVAMFRDLFGTESLIAINQGYQCTLMVEPLAGPPPELLPSAAARPSNALPPRAVTRIGREAELARAAADLAENRLLTLVGPGGIGKTWLARELGWRESDKFTGGAHLIDLAPVKEAAGVASTAAKMLGVALRGTKAPVEVIARSIRDRGPMLLIFDSCDYVAAASAAFIEGLMTRAANLTVLATSQQILNLPGERVLRLDPLPPADAIALLVALISAIDHRFERDGGNESALAEICRRVGCIPHALELVARRVPALGLEAMRAGLERDERFQTLVNGPLTAAARQQTLLATVDWSHGLLDAGDQKIFRRLACFSGSFSREAAIAVAGPDGATRHEMADALQRLVDKSLLTFEDGARPRYRLLETLQHYGVRKLEETGETENAFERHIRYFIALFDPADGIWETMPDEEWRKAYELEIDNVRVALDRSLEKPERTAAGIALAGRSGRLWYMLDLVPEGRLYCDQFVERIGPNTSAADAARLLRYDGSLWRYADRGRAVALMERSATLYREVGDRLNLGIVLGLIGGNCVYLKRHDEAKTTLDEAQEILSGGNLTKSQLNIMNDLGSLALPAEPNEARQYCVLARVHARKLKDVIRETNAIFNLGEVEFRLGAIDSAIEYAREAASELRSAGQLARRGPPLTNLASYLAFRGDHIEARVHAREALSLLIQEGGYYLRACVLVWALIAALEGRFAEAAQLVGWVDAEYDRNGEIREPTERQIYDFASKILEANLELGIIQTFTAEGASWDEDRAANFIVRRVVSPDDPAP